MLNENEKREENVENKAVGYIRVSTTDQAKGYSLDSQKEHIEQYCKDNNLELIKIYMDDTSGLNPDRDAINEMLNDAEEGKFNYVVGIVRDRLSRDPQFYGYIQFTLRKLGIELILTDEKNVKSEEDEMYSDLLSIFAKFETKRRMKRIRDAKKYAGERGYTMYKAPIGYKNVKHGVVIDEETVDKVRDVFWLRSKGWSYNKIKEEVGLNSHIMVRNILLNKKYYQGYVKYKGKWIKGQHEPILKDDN